MPDGIALRFDSVEYAAADERALQSVFLHPSSALLARAGRRPGPGLTVTIGGTPESATVAAGGGVIADPDGGAYVFVIPTAVALELAARPSTGNSRISYVLARIKDEDVRPGDTLREPDLYLLEGANAASPTAPSIPAGHLRIARLDIPSVGAIAVSQLAQRMAAAGGTLIVTDATERDAISPLYDGLIVYREDNDTFEGRVDGAWEVIFPQPVPWKTGTASLTFNGSGECTLTHDFGSVPTYLSAEHDSNGTAIKLNVKGGSMGASTCVLQARKVSDGTAYVGSLSVIRWLAVA